MECITECQISGNGQYITKKFGMKKLSKKLLLQSPFTVDWWNHSENWNFRTSVNQGKERITKFKTTLILSIIANIENHFESPKDDSVYPTFQLFNISIRTDATDTDLIIELDAKKTGDLAVCFTNPLDKHKFDLCQAMKEWI